MTTAPKIPTEQRSFADHGAISIENATLTDHRGSDVGVQSSEPGDAGVNLREPGQYGNLKQNLTNRWNVQER